MFSLPSPVPVEQKSDNLLHYVRKEKKRLACSSKDADSLTSKVGVCDDRHCSGSEMSNVISVCSSHDSSNENGENKAIRRISDPSEGMSVLSKVAMSQVVAEEKGLLESHLCGVKKIISNEDDLQKLSDSNGEDTSCVSRAESPSIPGDHISDTDNKNASHSFGSVNSSLQGGVEKAVDLQLAKSNCQDKHCSPSQPTDCIQEASFFPEKSDPCGVSSLRDAHASSKKVQEHSPKCSGEQEELYSPRIVTSIPGGRFDSAESDKPKSQVNEKAPAAAKRKHLEQNANLSDDPDVLRNLKQTQTAGSIDKEDVLIDVNVCDICGDVGREDLLAICSRCTDGAEHTYCMRVPLKKVPEDDWICEDCLQQEENKKHEGYVAEKVVRSPYESSPNNVPMSAEKADTKKRTCMDTKVANAGRNCQQRSGLVSRICGKRRMGSLKVDSAKKRKLLETSVGPSKMTSSKKALLLGDSLPKDLDKAKGKPTSCLSSFDDHSLNRKQKDESSSMISVTKSLAQYQASQGLLAKSKSFNISNHKGNKAGVRDEVLPEKKETNLDIAVCDKGEHRSSSRRLNKSLSLNNASSGHAAPAGSELKILPSNIPHCKDPIKAKHIIEQTSSPEKVKSEQELSRTIASSCTSLKLEKKSAADGATSFPGAPRSSYKPVPTSRNQSLPSELARRNEAKSICNGQAGSDVGKKLDPFLSKVFRDLSDLTSTRTPHERKETVVCGNAPSKSSASLLAGNQCNSSSSGGKDLLPKSQGIISQPMKTQRTSYLTSAGNRSLYFQNNDNFSKAAEIFPVESPETACLHRASSEEAKTRTDKDCKAKSDETAASGFMVIPKFDYIWKGGFKINCVGKHPSFCWGIQAHLSSRSSPRVPEVVRKLPSAIPLEEMSRMSVWPAQFLENSPNEDSIGLYFFAEDMLSYKGRYGNLLERMINDDIALIGKADGLDLLIFSSNLLPEKCQRWNRLYFLWGIFRGRRTQNGALKSLDALGSSTLNNPQMSPSISRGISNVEYLHPSSSCKGSGDYLLTKVQSQESSRSTEPELRDKNCTLAPIKEGNGFPGRMLDHIDVNSLPWNSSKAHTTSVAEDQCRLEGTIKISEAPFKLSDKPKDDNTTAIAETQFLDLGLSLGSSSSNVSEELVQADGSSNRRSGENIAQLSLELSLALPSYNA